MIRPTIPTVLVLALAATSVAAPGWAPLALASPGRIGQRIVDDLDGDGRREVLLFSGRRLILHTAARSAPVASFEVEPTALVFCVADVDADPRTREIVLLRRGGVSCHAMEDGRLDPEPRTVLEAEGLVTAGQRDDVHWRPIATDLDGDGLDDVVFPTRSGYRLVRGRSHDVSPRYAPGEATTIPYALRVAIGAGATGTLDRVRYEEGVPDWSCRDFDGDGRRDFALLPEGRIAVHRGTDDGFEETAAFWLDVGELRGAEGVVHPSLCDVNRDGIPDYLANEPWHGRTTIILGRRVGAAGRVELPAAAVVRRVNGWAWDPRLEDLDGDGYPDLILPTTERIGALEAAAVVVSGKLTVRNFVWLNTKDPERPFADEADAVREFDVEIRLSLDLAGRVRIGHTKIVSTAADFDRDGRKDLLLQTDDEELAVFRGEPHGVIAGEAWVRLTIPTTANDRSVRADLADFDGDGAPDILLHYESWARDRDRIVLLLSRKE